MVLGDVPCSMVVGLGVPARSRSGIVEELDAHGVSVSTREGSGATSLTDAACAGEPWRGRRWGLEQEVSTPGAEEVVDVVHEARSMTVAG